MHVVYGHKKTKNKWIVIAILVLLVFFNPFNIFDFLRQPLAYVADPIIKNARSVGLYFKNGFAVIPNIHNLHENNQLLQSELVRLESEIAKLEYLEQENLALRNEVGLDDVDYNSFMTAEIVLRDSFGGKQWIVIDRGSADGLIEGIAVTTQDSIFIGYIETVEYNRSKVRLIAHPESVINVKTIHSEAEAVAVGNHGLSTNIEDVPKDVDIKNGEMVVTSSIGDRFVGGLSLGKIHNIETSSDQLYKTAQLQPLVDVSKVRFVTLIKE